MPRILPAGQTADQIFALDEYKTTCLRTTDRISGVPLQGHLPVPSSIRLISLFVSAVEGVPAK